MNKEICKIASNRLKRIKLKLAIYNLNLNYTQGKKMVIADVISRACNNNTCQKSDFDNELNNTVHTIHVSNNLKLE